MKFTAALLALATLTPTISAAAIEAFSDGAALQPRQLIVCPAGTKGPICCDDDPNMTNQPDTRKQCRTRESCSTDKFRGK